MIQRAGRRARSGNGVGVKNPVVVAPAEPVDTVTHTTESVVDPIEQPPAVIKRSDMKLYERALKQGWDIPAEVFESLGATMFDIVRTGSNREKVAAARVLHALHGQNLADKPAPRVVAHAHVHRVEESPNAAPQTDTATTATAPAAADPAAHRRAALAARIARLR